MFAEALSTLKINSEHQTQKSFACLMKGRATIVMAHCFSMIRNARIIHVLDGGGLVASGTHEQSPSDLDELHAHFYWLQYRKLEVV